MTINTEKRFTEKEAAKILGISQMTLIRRRNEGAIRFYRVGSRILYGERHLEEFLAKCECGGTNNIIISENFQVLN